MNFLRKLTPDMKRKRRIEISAQWAEHHFDEAAKLHAESERLRVEAENHARLHDMYRARAAELRSQQ